MVAIELPPEVEQRLDALAHKSGRTKADYIYEALMEHLQDADDLAFAEEQMRGIESGEIKTKPLAEVMRKYGLGN
jgi:RHH-type transcriptional regulator, rel operon repressor / antitoxin RelB